MIWIDFAIIGIILISAFISLIRGFVREALSLVGWVVSFWVALTFAGGFAELFLQSIDDKTFRVVVGFGVLFVTALILFVIVNYFAVQLVRFYIFGVKCYFCPVNYAVYACINISVKL